MDAVTGHWDMGKTIGAGSMGKVKLAKNRDTHETVGIAKAPFTDLMLIACRPQSKSSPDSPLTSTGLNKSGIEQTIRKRFAQPGRLPL